MAATYRQGSRITQERRSGARYSSKWEPDILVGPLVNRESTLDGFGDQLDQPFTVI